MQAHHCFTDFVSSAFYSVSIYVEYQLQPFWSPFINKRFSWRLFKGHARVYVSCLNGYHTWWILNRLPQFRTAHYFRPTNNSLCRKSLKMVCTTYCKYISSHDVCDDIITPINIIHICKGGHYIRCCNEAMEDMHYWFEHFFTWLSAKP